MKSSSNCFYVLRLIPQQDPYEELVLWLKNNDIKAATIISAVGSFSKVSLRLADAKESQHFAGPFEVVSLSGTLSPEGLHLHVALADKEGTLLGGHLKQGSRIQTTLELVLLELKDLSFRREFDAQTGFLELLVVNK